MKPFKGMGKSNTALLVIDVINSCAHKNCEIQKWKITFSKIREMVPKLEGFIESYRNEINKNVVLTTTVPWRKEFVAENINELYEDPNAIYYTEDTSGFAEEFYLLKPKEADLIIDKNTNDAFADERLIKYLKERKIKYVVTTGLFTDGCVLASAAGGFSRGYNMVVLKDLVETTDSKTRQQLQKLLIKFTFPFIFARTLSSQEFLKS